MESIIRVEGLNKTYSGKNAKQVLYDITFDVEKGEVLGIAGESGSGKSTLVNILIGLAEYDSGSIFFEDKKLEEWMKKPLEFYEKIQMIFQNPLESFDPGKTFEYSLTEAMRNRGVSKTEALQRASDLMVACGLPAEYLKKYPHEVSGGECQRAAIARALVIKPDILICDEATSALDVTVQKQIVDLLRSIKTEQDLTVLFICHDMDLLEEFCDRAILIDGGIIKGIYS
ncbi:MAG: dipeptide/oligopeptide/nickel ABC transporter ATP-binding protein [Lachnospiraceae bacterium]|nr:dipeptide/oligopeptide/nickel ABC transporter ATP-binding protein [Lachnospiraceae bacterium]